MHSWSSPPNSNNSSRLQGWCLALKVTANAGMTRVEDVFREEIGVGDVLPSAYAWCLSATTLLYYLL